MYNQREEKLNICHRQTQSGSFTLGRIRVLVLRWARSQQVTNRHEHQRVLDLNVISQSKYQTYITEANKEIR